MTITQNLMTSAQALSPDQVARLKNQQYVESLKKAPAWNQEKTPYGINKALGSPQPASVLQPDQRFNQPGPSAELRPQPKPESL